MKNKKNKTIICLLSQKTVHLQHISSSVFVRQPDTIKPTEEH